VIGMAGFPVGNDDGARAKFAIGGGEAEFVGAGGLDVGVGDAEGAAVVTFRIFAARAASFARVSGVPSVPISPAVRSRMPVL